MTATTPRATTERVRLLVSVVALLAVLAGCELTVRPSGTTFAPANGSIRVVVPPGAVAEPVVVTVTGLDLAGAPGTVPGTGFTVTPAGGWERPIEVTLAYAPGALPRGVAEQDLVVVRRDGATWTPVAASSVDATSDRVRVHTTELGPLAVGWVGCDVRHPTTCTLAEAGHAAGVRIGATLEPDDIDVAAYASTLTTEFGSITPENALKMYSILPSPGAWSFAGADEVVAFAEANGMEIRGHTLVWAQDQFTPAWVAGLTDPDELKALTDDYISAVVGRYAGRIPRWDVVNEPLTTFGTTRSGSVWDDLLGPGWIADAFRAAHAADPDAALWLNEYGTDWVPGKHDALLALVTDLVAQGVPIDGVGLQVHRPSTAGPDPATFEAQLQAFADLGLEVAVTELDVPTNPTDPNGPTAQAAAYDRVVRGCLAVPACTEITVWGVTDARTWLDGLGLFPTPTRPLLFDEAYAPKPAYQAARSALTAGRPA